MRRGHRGGIARAGDAAGGAHLYRAPRRDDAGSTEARAVTEGFSIAGLVGVSITTAVADMQGKTRAYVGQGGTIEAASLLIPSIMQPSPTSA